MSETVAPTAGRRLFVFRLGSRPSVVAETADFGAGVRGSNDWTKWNDGWHPHYQPASDLMPEIWQMWNDSQDEIIYRFRINEHEARIPGSELKKMPGSDLAWVYYDPANGGWLNQYFHMVATYSNYLVAWQFNASGYSGYDGYNVSVWHFDGLNTAGAGPHEVKGYFS